MMNALYYGRPTPAFFSGESAVRVLLQSGAVDPRDSSRSGLVIQLNPLIWIARSRRCRIHAIRIGMIQ